MKEILHLPATAEYIDHALIIREQGSYRDICAATLLAELKRPRQHRAGLLPVGQHVFYTGCQSLLVAIDNPESRIDIIHDFFNDAVYISLLFGCLFFLFH